MKDICIWNDLIPTGYLKKHIARNYAHEDGALLHICFQDESNMTDNLKFLNSHAELVGECGKSVFGLKCYKYYRVDGVVTHILGKTTAVTGRYKSPYKAIIAFHNKFKDIVRVYNQMYAEFKRNGGEISWRE